MCNVPARLHLVEPSFSCFLYPRCPLSGSSNLSQQHRLQHVFARVLFSSSLGEANKLQFCGIAPVACWQAHEADSSVTLNANNEIYYLHFS